MEKRAAPTGAALPCSTIAEYNSSNTLQRRFVFDPTTGQPVVQYEGTGTTTPRYLSADERGSVIAQTDGSGALVGIDTYDEYGKPGASNIGRFQYTGQKWIGEAGLYDYKTRDYLPHLGIFAQIDPVEYADSSNLYAYVGDDPVDFVDPSGLLPEIVVTGQRDESNGSEFAPWGFSPVGNTSEKHSTSSILVLGRRPARPPIPLPLQVPQCVICNATLTGSWATGFVITARRRPNAPFVLIDGRYVYSGYVKPWYSNYFDACFAACPAAAGALLAYGGPALASRMATSRVFGVTSRFGNRYYVGRVRFPNRGAVRLGWSYNERADMLYFQLRIGDIHVPTVLYTPPPF